MKPSLSSFVLSTTVLLSWLSLHDDIHAAASAAAAENSMWRSQRNLRATGEFLPAELEGLFTSDAHTDTTPLWVQDRISPDNISEFLDNRDLMDDTELIFHDIKPYDTDFPIGQCYVSLDKDDLAVKNILSDDAVIMVDADTDIPRYDYDRIFESLVCNNTIVTLSRSGSLKEAFWKSKATGETVKVDRLLPHETIYVEYSSKDHDPHKLGSQYTDDVELVDEGAFGTRHLEKARRSPIAPPATIDNSLPFKHTNEGYHRNLQQSCRRYRRVQVALYLDSYFCELPQVNDEPFVDRPTEALAHASSIVAEASAFFELFCVKLEISSAMIKCDKSRHNMYHLVSATSRSVCEDPVFTGFRTWVERTGDRAFPGDIKIQCIGRAYVGTVCNLPWNTAVNEISVNTLNSNLFAHEAGHNLGADHDNNDGIMTPYSGGCRTCEFTQFSQGQMNSKLNQRSCVDSVTAPRLPSPTPAPVAPTRAPTTSPTRTPVNPTTAPVNPTWTPTITPSRNPVNPTPSITGEVSGFVLINSNDNSDIRSLKDGDEINLYGMQTANLNLRADTIGIVESVRFDLDGQSGFKTDSAMPYALGGEDKGDYYRVNRISNLGFHTVTATPFSENRGAGQEGKPMTVTFTVVKIPQPIPTQPTGTPTRTPTIAPTKAPANPTSAPISPTRSPTMAPTQSPTITPTRSPTTTPTRTPTTWPTRTPVNPTTAPVNPTWTPTITPSRDPVNPTPSITGEVSGFVLINSNDNSDIRVLKDGDEINLYGMQTTNLNLRADTIGIVESVRFDLDGQSGFKTDSAMPYALGGEDKGDYYRVNRISNLGFHTVTATPFSENRGAGQEGKPMTVTFTVVKIPQPMPTGTPVAPTSAPTSTPAAPTTAPVNPSPYPDSAVTVLVLIDATDSSEIHILSDGDLINLSDLQTTDLNIRAYTRGAVKSVKFDFDGTTGYKTDSSLPFALGGEVNGDFYRVNKLSKLGLHRVTATPFSENRGAGQEGTSMTVYFTIAR